MIDANDKRHIVSELERIFSNRESLLTYKESIRGKFSKSDSADAYLRKLLKLSNLFDNYCLCPTEENYTLLYSQIKKCELSVKWINRILNGLGIEVLSPYPEEEEEEELVDDENSTPILNEPEKPSTETKFCRKCGSKINISIYYCPMCGLVQKMKECWVCKREIPQNAYYCPFCNARNNIDKSIK